MNDAVIGYIPNWKRFCDRFHLDDAFVQEFEVRFLEIGDVEIREHLGERINAELGLLLLRDIEIGRETFEAMFSVFF